MQKTPTKELIEIAALTEQNTPTKEPIENSDLIKSFQPGDLLYGLEKEARAQFREFLEKKFAGSKPGVPYLTIDDINKELSPEYMFSPETDSPKRSPKQYHPIVEAHRLAWERNEKYAPSKINKVSKNRENKAFSFSCKVALLSHTQKIHFCLDYFDSEAIRNKDHKDYKSFTSKELRLCVKEWNQLKDRVVFYFAGEICKPPWGIMQPIAWLNDKSLSNQMDTLNLDEEPHKTPAKSGPGFFKLHPSVSPNERRAHTPDNDDQETKVKVSKKLFY